MEDSAPAERVVQGILSGRRLAVWVEVRDAVTGEPLYSFQAADDASNGDTVTVTHRIGDAQASAS